MFGFKNFLASKTVWTNLVGLICNMLVIWGIELDGETQAMLVTLITTLMAVGSSVFRAMAKKQLVAGSPDRVEMSGRHDR